MIAGARRRSWRGVHLIAAGAGLIGCAAAGFCNPRHAAVRWRHLMQPPTDRGTIESIDSFPASDAPASSAMAVSAALLWDS